MTMTEVSIRQAFWSDEAGAILSAELVIVLTLVVLGLITGLACLQQAVIAELQDVSAALSGLNQSYFTPSFRGCLKIWGRTSATAGSFFVDRRIGLVGGVAASSAELGVGGPRVLENITPRVVTPGEACTTCPPVESRAAGPEPCTTCPPAGPSGCPVPATDIPQGPAPQISPQTW